MIWKNALRTVGESTELDRTLYDLRVEHGSLFPVARGGCDSELC